MYMLKTEASFDSAHFLYGYKGKCSSIHGHRWKIEVIIKSDEIGNTGQHKGMITDFSILKKDLNDIADLFDHALIYETGTLKQSTIKCLLSENFRLIDIPFRPTAENLSKHFYNLMQEKGYAVDSLTVYETPNNCAIYTEK